jgi:photosystem II stability/assembly factor-like uncharacterized protein
VRRSALCVLLTVAAVGCGRAHNAAQPLPAAFVPSALSALDDRDFFLLGTLPCSAGRCYAIERTADAGRNFTRMRAPRGLPSEGTSPTLRFADARDGFVWVPFDWGALYATHDGGATWRRMTSPALVAFTTTDGTAYAVEARCTPSACNGYRFARAPVSSGRWSKSPLPFTPDGPVMDIAARGRDVWLLGTPRGRFARHDVLARSTDGGRTFSTMPGPCFPGLGGDLEPSSPRVVWAVCPTGMMAGAARSTDGGATFVPLQAPPLVNAARLSPSSDETAVLAANGAGRPLYRTSDGGRSWRPTATSGRDEVWSDVAFTDARVGEALVQVGARAVAVWRTTDGGASWSRIRSR